MTLTEAIESTGFKRPDVRTEYGESETLENGTWTRHRDTLGEYAICRFPANAETNQIYQVYLHNDTVFAFIITRHMKRKIIATYPQCRVLIDADDCWVLTCPVSETPKSLLRMIRLGRKRGREITPDEAERLKSMGAAYLYKPGHTATTGIPEGKT